MNAWWRGLPRPAGDPRPVPARVDVAVVGGGYAGLCIAEDLLTAAPGLRVAVLDAHHPGAGASGRNAGSVLPLAMPLWLLRGSAPGHPTPALLRALHDRVQRRMADLRRAHPSASVTPAPMVLLARTRLHTAALGVLADALVRIGLPAEVWDGDAAWAATGSRAHSALVLPAWTVQPARLCVALASAVAAAGGSVHGGAAVVGVGHGRDGLRVHLRDGRTTAASRVVVATGAWTPGLGLPDAPAGAVVHTAMRAGPVLGDSALADLGDAAAFRAAPDLGMAYWRVHDRRVLFGGLDVEGADPDRELGPGAHRRLDRLVRRWLPGGGHGAGVDRWSGPLLVTRTESPVVRVSRVAPGLVYAVGFAGSGLSLTLTGGPLVRDLVLAPAVAAPDEEAVALRAAIGATRMPWAALASGAGAAVGALVRGRRPGPPLRA